MLGRAVRSNCLLRYELLTEGIDVLLVFALFVEIAGRRKRRAIFIETYQAVGSSRTCGWHDKRLWTHRKPVRLRACIFR